MQTITLTCDVPKSFRTAKVAGMFDVPIAKKASETITFDQPPAAGGDWRVGAIVGPSGSGKSSIARHVYGDCLYTAQKWPKDQAVIDAVCSRKGVDVKAICGMLTAVGFSSPPAWIKPYHVLSNGQQFRVDLARGLLSEKPLIVFDEFTSVVDRTVAKIGSAAVAKAVRRHASQQFVAVACHYDILEWLEPDWILDLASGKLARGSLRRPAIRVDVRHGKRAAWPLFAKHHYLSASLPGACRCFYAEVAGELVGFVATCNQLGRPGWRRVSRIVVLPDWQGVGIGQRLLDAVASLERATCDRVGITTSHPGMIAYLDRAQSWRVFSVKKQAPKRSGIAAEAAKHYTSSTGRATVSAVYLADA